MEALRQQRSLTIKDRPLLFGLLAVLTVWNVISWGFPFFWDTVLNSRIAQWYIESGFSSITVPEVYDAGHPPFFSVYLAVMWKVFGKSLVVAHLAMLPFLWLIGVQFFKLAKRFVGPRMLPWALLLLICEPTFLAQSSMITPDIAMVAFFLLALNAILEKRRWLLGLALPLMAAMSFRGILTVPAIFLLDVAIAWWKGARRPNWKGLLAYGPVSVLVLIWTMVHYKAAGWLLSPPAETYGEHRQIMGIAGMAKNAAVIVWRWLDLGRFLVWGFVGAGLFVVRRKGKVERHVLQMLLLALIPAMWLALLFLPFSNPIGHRYFMVSYMLLGIVAVILLEKMDGWKRILAGSALALCLVGGHFWVYPDTMAQGWDSSLAHLRIHGLNDKMEQYFVEKGVDRGAVCSDFPLLPERNFTHLADKALNPVPFAPLFEYELKDCEWVLQSNVSNGFSDEDLAALQGGQGWKLVQEYASGGVYLRLYQAK